MLKFIDKGVDKIYSLVQRLLQYTDDQESFDKIHQIMIKGAQLNGSNTIILFCAALIASVGLSQNSIPIIIGAMLISPLMGPILGFGYGTAIYDKYIILFSFKNLVKSIGIALAASIIFFLLTPLNEPTTEILNRTAPTPYDIIVAFIGGVAGIVAITRTEKTNVIPGVAIATALMPPLCTIGYGIAKWDQSIILGASYLFFINIFFIVLSTILIIKALGLNYERHSTVKIKRGYVMFAIIIVSLPSFYFGYQIISESIFNSFVSDVGTSFDAEGKRVLVDYQLDRENNEITFEYYGDELTKREQEKLNKTINEKANEEFTVMYKQLTEDEAVKDVLIRDQKVTNQNEDKNE